MTTKFNYTSNGYTYTFDQALGKVVPIVPDQPTAPPEMPDGYEFSSYGYVYRWDKKLGVAVAVSPEEPKKKRKHRSDYNPERKRFLRSPEWRAIRSQVLDRDGHQCVECGSDGVLNVHHKDFSKDNHALDNLETLCWNCHMRKHHRR